MNFTKKHKLYIFLVGLFLTNAIIAEIIGAKIFSVEGTLGIEPIQLAIGSQKFDFNMSAGVLNWPVVFIVSDLINEYFGVKGVKRISYLTAGLLVYGFIIIYLATLVAPAAFWTNLYSTDSAGNPLNINESFGLIFRQGLGIIVGSLVAFLVGQLLDAYIFKRLRKATKNKHIWLRATGSTVVSQLIDSFLVLFIAFYVFGKWPLEQIAAVGTVNYIYKFVVALLITPIIYLAHYFIDRYLGEELSENLIKEATHQ